MTSIQLLAWLVWPVLLTSIPWGAMNNASSRGMMRGAGIMAVVCAVDTCLHALLGVDFSWDSHELRSWVARVAYHVAIGALFGQTIQACWNGHFVSVGLTVALFFVPWIVVLVNAVH